MKKSDKGMVICGEIAILVVFVSVFMGAVSGENVFAGLTGSAGDAAIPGIDRNVFPPSNSVSNSPGSTKEYMHRSSSNTAIPDYTRLYVEVNPRSVARGESVAFLATLCDSSGNVLNKPLRFYVDNNFAGVKRESDPTFVYDDTNNLEIGTHELKVVFEGDSQYKPASKCEMFMVNLSFREGEHVREILGDYARMEESAVEAVTDEAIINVALSSASFTGSYNNYGIDTDGDGKYDYLVIDVGVDIEERGKYRIEGSLKDHSSGDYITDDSTYRILDTGVQDVTLKFNGYQIYKHGASGYFDLKDLKIYDKDWNRLDYRSYAYTTSYYSYTYFDVPPADLTGSYSNYGIDTDGDGKYNYLAIDVWMNVKEAGRYEVYGHLEDSGGQYITSDWAGAYLSKGLQKLTLKFNGYDIYRKGVNGPFSLDYVDLDDDEENREVDYKHNAYTTSFYYYTDFDIPPADLTGSYSDYGIDADGDGNYDYLAIGVWVNVKEAGYYYVSGGLEDCYGHDITSGWNHTYLKVGLQKLTLEFNGYEIYRNGVSGSFNLDSVRLYHGGTVDSKNDAYTTSSYYYTDFDVPPIDLTGAYADYGVDTDGNGKYDYLAIDVGVNVKEAGTYEVYGDLNDNENEYITDDWDEVELSTGLQKLTLMFEGSEIYWNGIDGPFNLGYVSLSDEWNKADYNYDAHFTSYYNHTEFDREFAGIVDVCFDIPRIVIIGETFCIRGAVSGGATVDVFINDVLYAPLNDLVIDRNNEFEAEVVADSSIGMGTRETVKLKVWVNCPKNPGDAPPAEPAHGETEIRLIERTAEFAPGFNDYGLDTDGNTLYDYLVIEKEIIVKEAGNYSLSGSLRAPSGEWIDSDYNYIYLDVGLHSMKLQFDGLSIYNLKESGNFDVDMWLDDEDSGGRLGSTTNTTSYYSYTAFERPPAEFASGFNDYGLDTNGNSLYNYLVIEKQIIVRKAGSYRLRGWLYSPSGKYIESDSNYTYLDVGLHSLKLQFYGPGIYNAGESGSFKANMDIYDQDSGEVLGSTTNTTSYYSYTEFERPPAEFAAGFNDYGLDTDGNSLYDYLIIEKEITVKEAGNYRLRGWLYTPSGKYIEYDSNYTYLDVGLQSLKLQFYGPGIYNAGESGSFKANMDIYDQDSGEVLDSATNTTSYYSYTDFERPPAEFAQGFNDYGLDTDGNSLYDYLVIEKEIIVREAGNYSLSGSLRSPSGEWIDSDYNYTYLDMGLHSLKLQFYGPSIYNKEESGKFDVDMWLDDEDSGGRLDSTTNTTSYYSYTEFERPPAEFAAGFNDYGLDTDGNSLYDYLIIEKEITVKEAGNYRLRGWLYTPSGKYIEYDSNYTYLDVGLHSLKLQFYGLSIYLSEESGDFDVNMDLYNQDSGEGLESTTNTTTYYSYTDFERPPAEFTGNFTDYGLDTDGDGSYNYLVVEAEVNITKAGEYRLRGTLYGLGTDGSALYNYLAVEAEVTITQADEYGLRGNLYTEGTSPPSRPEPTEPPATPAPSPLDYDSNRTYLETGIYNIMLQFDGIDIYTTEYNGSFKAELKLRVVEEGIEIDDAEYRTSEYHYTNFDPVMPPAIVSLTANPNTNISKDNPAVIKATITGDYLKDIILFSGEKVESNETTNIYELRSVEWTPSDRRAFVGNNTYDITEEWNATARGSYAEEMEGYSIGCYHATDGINETYPLIWEFPAFNRTIYLTYHGSFLHNGTWYDAAIGYFPDTAKVEYVVSSNLVFLSTADPKLIEDYPNAKSIDPNAKCRFNNILIKTASNGTIIGFPFGYGEEETRESDEFRIGDLKIKKNVPLPAGEYIIGMEVQDEAGNNAIKGTTVFTSGMSNVFDTGPGTYPSLMGTHNGTIKPSYDINVSKMYTYPCAGTAGHTESVSIYGNDVDESASWNGYAEDWDTLTFDSSFTLEAGKTYNYVIKTGSYPQIHHTPSLQTETGWLNCTSFVDANGKEYKDWIPAIRLFL